MVFVHSLAHFCVGDGKDTPGYGIFDQFKLETTRGRPSSNQVGQAVEVGVIFQTQHKFTNRSFEEIPTTGKTGESKNVPGPGPLLSE